MFDYQTKAFVIHGSQYFKPASNFLIFYYFDKRKSGLNFEKFKFNLLIF